MLVGSPKRKRDLVEHDDLPSSSRLGLPLPQLTSPKRRKRGRFQAKPLEIASTPDSSPRRSALDDQVQLTGHIGESILIADDSESEAGSPEDGGDPVLDDRLLGRPASPTLSSPSRRVPNTQASPRRNTQDVFKDPTQLIDFGDPDPDEGWDDASEATLPPEGPDPNSQLVDSPRANIIPETQPLSDEPANPELPDELEELFLPDEAEEPELPDTRALLGSKTQMPDFFVAEPDGGWDTLALIPSSPPAMPDHHSSPPPLPTKAPSPSPKKLKASMDTWVSNHLSAGYPVDSIIAALKATSNNLDRAKFVLKYMTRKGKGRIPSNERGIWTEDDDRDLESTHARRIEKVQAKHGTEICDVRLAFLHNYRQSEKV